MEEMFALVFFGLIIVATGFGGLHFLMWAQATRSDEHCTLGAEIKEWRRGENWWIDFENKTRGVPISQIIEEYVIKPNSEGEEVDPDLPAYLCAKILYAERLRRRLRHRSDLRKDRPPVYAIPMSVFDGPKKRGSRRRLGELIRLGNPDRIGLAEDLVGGESCDFLWVDIARRG